MAEKIEVFSLRGAPIGVEERRGFYASIKREFAAKGAISRKIKTVRLLLMNSSGRVYLQKRSQLKEDNAGLYDKTIGGHVLLGETFDIAAIRECAEELGFPAAIIPERDFRFAVSRVNVGTIGLFRRLGVLNHFESVRILKDGGKMVQPLITAIYIGYYDGAIRFSDGESSGIEVFSLSELRREIRERPGKFTEDLKFMVSKYSRCLRPILKSL